MASAIMKQGDRPPLTNGTPAPAMNGGKETAAIVAAMKERVRDAVYQRRGRLTGMAHAIHEHPEPAFAEQYAAARLAELLAEEGFAVRRGICDMPTAFVATFGDGPLHVAFCAEYDAIPPTSLHSGLKPEQVTGLWANQEGRDVPLRHACGHNLIAGVAVAAAVGLRDVAGEAGLTLSLFGTPGEELIGLKDPPAGHLAAGKVRLWRGGAFDGVNALLMVHPGQTPYSMIAPSKAGLRLSARFSKASSVPSGRRIGPHEAALLHEALLRAVRPLRQAPYFCVVQPEGDGGGARADIFYAGVSLDAVMAMRDRVRRCFEEAAAAAATTVEVIEYLPSDAMRQDSLLSATYRRNWQALGSLREHEDHVQEEMCQLVPIGPRFFRRFVLGFMGRGLFLDRLPADVLWGTDLGEASQFIPAIQPFIGIGGMAAAHTTEFAERSDSEDAYRAMLDGGVALAWTALDGATDPALRAHLLGPRQRPSRPNWDHV